MNYNAEHMKRAIACSCENIDQEGGPFGAVIVKDGKIIAEGTNRVTASNDPTAHAEIVAIRNATKYLNNFSLAGCQIYTSCEPCPMCLSAIYWARIDAIYYANTRDDAKEIGFDDSFIYDEIALSMEKRAIPIQQFLREEGLEAFKKWSTTSDKTAY
ncbi:nucleoside deaminase [Faecalibacter rhinopitheci]|uniref:Nucleoside deaminase n=1 Tax=Faecalibacter rhinopitheci TaxID=2779678 RepID=A0A8J7FR04_9FLAO|nr:nucleoside deaminase [Faecalibacter rhinopitheci]MBF0597969.1 nucleoside deaminase [Faecalibacter rhinopitheci]MBQ0146828.1 nucleoside deaminase [Candidatus Onthonaster equi]